MRLTTGISSALLLLLLAAGTATAGGEPEQSIAWFLDALQATPRPCPETIEYSGYAESAVCADIEADTKRFRKLLRKVLNRGREEPSELLEERKSKDGSLYGARIIVKGQLVDLYHDIGKGTITLISPLSCLENPDGSVPLLAELRPELESPPVVEHREPPVYPEQARVQRTPGIVLIDGTIGPAGQVTESCVLFVSPAGLGFEEASLSALRQWTFQPARLDGKPEPTAWRTLMTFEIRSPWMN